MDERVQYYPGLDIIKFLASIIILLHHYYLNTNLPELRFFARGGIFVELFFMISGFLGGGVKLNRVNQIPYWKYIVCIIKRILPMVLLSILIYAILGIQYYLQFGSWYRAIAIDFWVVITSLTLSFSGGAVGNVSLGINNPIWFICVLLICHTFLYVIQKLSTKYQFYPVYGFICMIFLGISAVTYKINLPFLNASVARGYYSFFLGSIIAILLDKTKNRRGIYVFALVTILIYVLPKLLGWSFMYNNWRLSIPLVFFPAILTLGTYPLQNIMIEKISRFIGGWSFEIYIWHGVILLVQGFLYKGGLIQYNFTILVNFFIIVIIFSLLMYSLEKRLNSFFWKKVNSFISR